MFLPPELSPQQNVILSDIDLSELLRAVEALPENLDDVPAIYYTRIPNKVNESAESPSPPNNKRALNKPSADPPGPKRRKVTVTSITPAKARHPKSKGKRAYQNSLRRDQRRQNGSGVKRVALKRAHAALTLPSGISRDDPASIRVSSTAWTGVRCKPEHKPEAREYSLPELLGDLSFDLVNWDGRTPILFLDKEGRVIVVLAGRPRMGWDAVVDGATEIIEEARPRCNFPDEVHRRGNFAAIATGISFGGGQKVFPYRSTFSMTIKFMSVQQPGILKNKEAHHEILRDIFSTKPFMRISGFLNCAYIF